jgi:hypothetical protein
MLRNRPSLDSLDSRTLLNLLQMYETATAELESSGDLSFSGLLLRFERRRAEVIAELSARGEGGLAAAS